MDKYIELYEKNLELKRKRSLASSPFKKASLYYAGYDPKFHNYTIYNGEKVVNMRKKSLRMGKKACEDWASLLWSEKLDIAVSDKEKAVPYLTDIGFWRIGAKAVELAFGMGISAVAVSLDAEYDPVTKEINRNTAVLHLDYFDAMNIVPISYVCGQIAEVALFSKDGEVSKMTAFVKDEQGNYEIVVVTEDSDGNKYSYNIPTNSTTPMFAIFYPNIVDNDSQNFHGFASILQNSIGTLQSIDNSFDGMDNEVTLGRKRIFASASLTKVIFEKSENGGSVSESRRTFDPNDTVIYALPETNSTETDKPFLWSPNDPLRIDQFTMDITFNLQLFSQQVGLGANYYRFDGGRIMTATQVISQNSDTYRNLKKHEQALEPAIKQLYRGIVKAIDLFLANKPFNGNEKVEVIFDDSIIEDRQTEKESDIKDLQNGIIKRSEFRAKWRGEEKAKAEQNTNSICGDEDVVSRFNALAPAIASGIVTSRLAVYIIFEGKEELLKKAKYNTIDDYAADVEENSKAITPDDLLAFNDRSQDGGRQSGGENPEPSQNDAQKGSE